MTKDELMLAFRMIAMGRPTTPHVEQLADFLLGLAPAVPKEPEVFEVPVPAALEIELPAEPAKRGRKPRAD